MRRYVGVSNLLQIGISFLPHPTLKCHVAGYLLRDGSRSDQSKETLEVFPFRIAIIGPEGSCFTPRAHKRNGICHMLRFLGPCPAFRTQGSLKAVERSSIGDCRKSIQSPSSDKKRLTTLFEYYGASSQVITHGNHGSLNC